MKLKVNEDLQPVYDLIFRVQRSFPQYNKNIRQITHTVDQHIGRYNNHLWEYSRKQHPVYLERAQQELDEIAAVLTLVERMELLALLSGEQRPRPEP